MKIALIHDWLTGMRGGERCLEVFCELFPTADLFTLFYRRGAISSTIERMHVHTSLLQHLPYATRYYRYLLPAFPLAIRQFNLSDYSFILSSSHAVAKGVRHHPQALHICYCFTPMRYIWDQSDLYFPRERFSPPSWAFLQVLLRLLRAWDVKTSRQVDEFIAISRNIAAKIQTYYNRQAIVIYPPVDCAFFQPDFSPRQSGDAFYLMVTALVPYKRVALAVEVCNRLQRPLIVIGTGPERRKLEQIAGAHTRFLGWQPDEVVRDYYRRCRALIFPGEEDFGIVPLEAQACGKPVIALARGGVLETVNPCNGRPIAGGEDLTPTGVFFDEPNAEALCGAIHRFEQYASDFDPLTIRRHALRFDRPVFKDTMQAYITRRIGVKFG